MIAALPESLLGVVVQDESAAAEEVKKAAVLDWVGSPMDLEDLVNGLAELLDLKEAVPGNARGRD